jgi:predicted transposase/invertase (TIGR01784 family)
LINAIRHPEAPIEVVEILNPRIEPDELLGKYIVLDILARDGQGHFYNIEMQVRRRPDWSARSVYYMAKALADQLKSGAAYSALQPVIGIHLLDFELFTDDQQSAQAVWCFELRDRTQPTVCVAGDSVKYYRVAESRPARSGRRSRGVGRVFQTLAGGGDDEPDYSSTRATSAGASKSVERR